MQIILIDGAERLDTANRKRLYTKMQRKKGIQFIATRVTDSEELEVTEIGEKLTHWRKLHNPDYLGSYALEPGKDMVVTIKNTGNEMVVGADGKKEECMVMHFEGGVKPMIVNSTNAKAITKVLKTPYIEKWSGSKIQLFSDRIKAFGEIVDALRVRPFMPKEEIKFNCSECKSELKATSKMTTEQLAKYTKNTYNAILCATCATKQ